MDRITKAEAREQVARDGREGRRVFQREYAKAWGVSVGTVNAWLKDFRGPEPRTEPAESSAEPGLNSAESGTEPALNSAEPGQRFSESGAEFSSELNAIRAEIASIQVALSDLAKNYSKLFQELTPLLASLGEGAFSSVQSEFSSDERASDEVNPELNATAERAEQPALLELTPPDRSAPPDEDSPWLRLLTGKPPERLDGTRPASALEWLRESWPVLVAEVEKQLEGEDCSDKAFNARLKPLLLRWWKHRRPAATSARAPRKPVRREAGSWQHG